MSSASRPAQALELRGGALWSPGGSRRADLALKRGRVEPAAEPGAARLDLDGRDVLPGLVNAHDHLDLSVFPPLGQPPYANGYAWAASVEGAGDELSACLAMPLRERLWLGGLRNLLSGATAVAHHGADHRALGERGFPVGVQRRYQFALSPGQTPALRKTYRSSDRRIPWFVHAGEGKDARAGAELDALQEANVLRHNTVVVRGLAFGPRDAARMAAARACLVWCPEADRRQYAATVDVRAMRAAGVRFGLGSESPAAGGRDLLSSLCAARREGLLSDVELLELATHGSGEVARLECGGFTTGAPADFVAADSLAGLLQGERSAIALMVVAGRALYGTPALLAAAGQPAVRLRVDGAERALAQELAGPLRAGLQLAKRGPAAEWLSGLSFD